MPRRALHDRGGKRYTEVIPNAILLGAPAGGIIELGLRARGRGSRRCDPAERALGAEGVGGGGGGLGGEARDELEQRVGQLRALADSLRSR